MAVLADADRVVCWQTMMTTNRDPISVIKTDLRAAIDATDAWIDGQASAYNSALPAAARAGLTTKEKALLFMIVAARRYGIL